MPSTSQDPFGSTQPTHSEIKRANGWALPAAVAVALIAMATALLRWPSLSLVAYLFALVAGTAFLAIYRIQDARASRSASYVPNRTQTQLAIGAAVLIVLACAVNGFIWATEVAKQ